MIYKDFEKELFQDELKNLQGAREDLANPQYQGNPLFPRYKDLVEDYEKLLRLTRKIFKISDSQGRSLKRRESEIKNLLDNANQGFLTFGKDLLVDREYSAECMRIFEKRIANLNILELLVQPGSDDYQLLANAFENAFSTNDLELKYHYLQQVPKMLKLSDKEINIEFKVLEPLDENDILMLISTDVTEKRRAEAQVEYLSYHDKLTSLYNRAYIDTILKNLDTPENLPFSIIMADMNGLKITNDVFGHQKGDELLVEMSNILTRCCRSTDIIARWGGDEFLILLPGAGEAICQKVCTRIKDFCRSIEPSPIPLSIAVGTATKESIYTDLSELFNIAENRMYSNKISESQEVRKKIIMSLEKTFHERCFENDGHTERVKALAFNFAQHLGWEENSAATKNLLLLASLHDIGKVAIPREILGKVGPLTSNEWEIMQNHSEIGCRMARSIGESTLAEAILAMHEYWDGSGYPQGLKEEQIPLISRVCSIIDVYDILTHERPYGKTMSSEDALEEIREKAGSQFDPNLVEVFLREIRNWEILNK